MPAEPQIAPAVLMIRPVRFFANPETRASNAFQRDDLALAVAAQQARAAAEFEGLAAALRAAGVAVHAFDDTPEPATPDAIFPNNWVSFHADGRVVLYPMLAPNRRAERRPELLAALRGAYAVAEVVDLTHHEAAGRFLEGTGSLVLDRPGRVAYACRSPRTHEAVLAEFAARLGYAVVAFDAFGPDAAPIYHTNVLMAVGEGFAVIGAEAIPAEQRGEVLTRLAASGREVVALTPAQLGAFAGNMLALRAADGGQVLAMSARAEACLTPDQRAVLARHARVVAAPVPTIEDCAGGSVRCMLAEVFLPPA